jgi:hypothetical protein
MKVRSTVFTTALLLFLLHAAGASETNTFESCSDTAGRSVAVVPDENLPKLVASDHEAQAPTIRYNPNQLPRLKPATRLFFFAHECARHAMGDADKPSLSVARAREADCLGLATLLDSGLLKRENLAELQADLSFSESEWMLLPGLPRSFDLAACSVPGVLRLPPATLPSDRQSAWNGCVRACADRLWNCQKKCRGQDCAAACLETHGQCESACGGRPEQPSDQSR